MFAFGKIFINFLKIQFYVFHFTRSTKQEIVNWVDSGAK